MFLVRNATIYTKILAFLVLSFRVKKKLIVLGGPVDTSFPFFARRFKFFPIRSPHAREKTKI